MNSKISVNLFKDFFESEKSGGIILLIVALLSLSIANSPLSEGYLKFWSYNFSGHTLAHWINDGLMAIFFLLIGLELEREIYSGELSNLKNSMLPLFAALGGILAPAGIHFLLNNGTPYQSGAGIPMATDIAFAIGTLSLLGKNVPIQLKVFLAALAVIDDLCAIIVIAVFYTTSLSTINLFVALGVFGLLLLFNRLKIHFLSIYLLGGVIIWYFMLHSGVHATIAGVLLAFAIPYGSGDEQSLSFKMQHWLHKPVAFFILPIFAAANTGIVIQEGWYNSLLHNNSLGIILGLTLGKPVGIFLFSYIALRLKLARLPKSVNLAHVFGTGILAGIGFTMSIFITLLAFTDQQTIADSKIAIMIASMFAGIIGFVFLRTIGKPA